MTNNDHFKIDKSLKFSEIFGTEFLKEEHNRKALKYMLLHWDEYEGKCIEYDNGEDDSTYNPKQILEKYLDKAKCSNIVEVKYKKSSISKKYGRWFAEGSLSIQNMPRKVRHTICKGLWIDLDFKNCHPVILEQLCIHYGIECPLLHKYNTDRSSFIKEIMDAKNCDRDFAKRCILKILNGSKLNINVPWWSNMKTEFKIIANFISSNREYDKFYKIVKANKSENIDASIMNMILCYFEDKCLQTAYKYLVDKKVIINNVCCLIFDGLQVQDTQYNRNVLTSVFLNEVSNMIYKKTGFQLEIDIKDFNEALELPEGYDTSFEDTYMIESGDDKSAAEFVINKYKHLMKKCNGRVFVHCDGIWVHSEKDVYHTLFNIVSKLDIRKEGVKNTFVYSRNKKSIKDCVDIILADDSYIDNTFVDRLFSSNLYYLAFNNGIWSFKEKKLYSYNELPDVYFTKKINRDFNEGDKKYVIDGVERDLKHCKQLVYDKIINPILPFKEQQKYFLMCLARALAGHYADKRWYVAQGARDCGKGMISTLLEKAFQSFIGLFKSDNFLCSRIRVSGDEAKKLSWLVCLEFCRIALANEITTGKNIKMNGDLIKGLASGGDTQQARQNHKDEMSFKLQCTMFMLCNELPDVDPKDTLQNLENFMFKSKFVNQQDIDEIKKINDDNLQFFKLKDDDIKVLCENDYVIDAFTSIIFDHYEQDRPAMPGTMISDNMVAKGDNAQSFEIICTKIFQKTSNEDDKLTMDDIVEKIEKLCNMQDIEEKQIKAVFAKLGLGIYGRYSINSVRSMGYKCVKVRDNAQELIHGDEADR
jgi:hypothetical protein